MRVLFHHAARERRVERRQAQRAVLQDLDQLTAGAKEQHRAELRVGGCCPRSARSHRSSTIGWTVTPGSARRRRFSLTDARIAPERIADTGRIAQVEHARRPTSVLCVIVLRVELEHDRIADLGPPLHGFVLGRGDQGLDGRDAVGGEDAAWIRPRSGCVRPPGARASDDRLRCRSIDGVGRLVVDGQRWRLVEGADVARIPPHGERARPCPGSRTSECPPRLQRCPRRPQFRGRPSSWPAWACPATVANGFRCSAVCRRIGHGLRRQDRRACRRCSGRRPRSRRLARSGPAPRRRGYRSGCRGSRRRAGLR